MPRISCKIRQSDLSIIIISHILINFNSIQLFTHLFCCRIIHFHSFFILSHGHLFDYLGRKWMFFIFIPIFALFHFYSSFIGPNNFPIIIGPFPSSLIFSYIFNIRELSPIFSCFGFVCFSHQEIN